MRRSLLMALVLAGCNLPGTTPPTVVCSEQHSWENYHLPHDSLRPVVRNESSYVPDLAAWNALGTPVLMRDDGPGFTITVRDGGDESSGWLGLATVRVAGAGHITEGSVFMNRTLLARYPAAVARHVLCQEIGHVIGLDHQHADDSCMDDCSGRASHAEWLACLSSEAGQTPNAHDAEQLREIYEHAVEPGDTPPPVRCQGELVLDVFGGER